MLPISKIGKGQIVDVAKSGNEMYNEYFRTCTVLQGNPPVSDIGDNNPFRMTSQYGRDWQYWNRHFIVQVSGCALRCWYCYVDNFSQDIKMSPHELVQAFGEFKSRIPELNVFHLMGGNPGRYSIYWRQIRYELDLQGFEDVLFLSNVILIEYRYHKVKSWLHIPERSIINVCIKGSNPDNYFKNTGRNTFESSIKELGHYQSHPNVHFQIIEWDEEDVDYLKYLLGPQSVDWFKVKNYEVVKQRKGEFVNA